MWSKIKIIKGSVAALVAIAILVIVVKMSKQELGSSQVNTPTERTGTNLSRRESGVSKERSERPIRKSSASVSTFSYDEIVEQWRKIKNSGQSDIIPIEEFRKIRDSLIAQDPDTLMELTEELIAMDDIRLLDAFNPSVIRSLIERGVNPAALGEWISGLQSGPARDRLLGCAGAQYFDTNPEGLHSMFDSIKDDKDRLTVLTGYYQKLIVLQPQRAVKEFLSQLPGEAGYIELNNLTVMLPAHTNFQSIAELIDSDSSEAAMEAKAKLLETWARFDPKKAADYAWSTEDVSSDVMKSAMEQWYRSSPDEARTWLYTRPSSPKLDQALGQLARTEAKSRPRESLIATRMIADEELRKIVQTEIYQKWHTLQPEKAEEAWKQAQSK